MAGTFHHRALTALVLLLAASGLSGCLGEATAPHLKPIPAATQARMAKLGMTAEAPILMRIFKEEAELEIWKQKDDGRFHLFKSYPICNFSGDLGPKLKEGDKQAPEGFYTVSPGRMNPNSNFHLSFNLGYPNYYDAALGRTGAHLMVHGDCSSAGCYAMTDALIEEIYAIAREAFEGGQRDFHVHAFPFRMTDANMARHRGHRWYGFWQMLKDGYDAFEQTRVQPSITVCEKRYVVNAEFLGDIAKPDPQKACPPHRILDSETILARLAGQETQVASQSRSEAPEPAEATASITQTPRPQASPPEAAPQRPVVAVSASSAQQSTQAVPDEPAPAETAASEPPADAGPWIVPEEAPAGAKGDRETGSST
jgi:murein L,D-transpeptidase YafK